jgi:hypothetical protein
MRRLALILIAASATLHAADPKLDDIAWGLPDHGARMGIGFGPAASPDPQLRLVVQCVEQAVCAMPLGSSSSAGNVYSFAFTLTAPDGSEHVLFDFNGPAGVAAASRPILISLARGAKHEVLLSMKKLIYSDNGRNRTLTDLLSQGYAIRAALDTTGDTPVARTQSGWAGTMTSGKLKR